MKTSMSSFSLPLLLLAALPLTAQQAEKTLVKSFNVDAFSTLSFDLEGDVTVSTWNEPQLQIQMTITLLNGTETMLKSLVTAGRYNLEAKDTNGNVVIIAPGLERQIKLSSGMLLGEKVTYSVKVPKGLALLPVETEATGMVTPKVGTN